jgi:glycosyltransferase involved in cell wall biosynthesis
MTAVVQAFDIGVVPSIACEASSFSLMEQMAAERPMVVSDHGGSKEIVRDRVDGFVVPAGAVEPIENALRMLAANAALRSEMGASARLRVLNDFTVEIFAHRTLEAYREALAIHRSRVASKTV